LRFRERGNLMDGTVLKFEASGRLTEYKEPCTVIKCETEYDYNRLEYLLDLGKATEKAYKNGYVLAELDQVPDGKGYKIVCHHAIGTIKGLLEYDESEEI